MQKNSKPVMSQNLSVICNLKEILMICILFSESQLILYNGELRSEIKQPKIIILRYKTHLMILKKMHYYYIRVKNKEGKY